VLKVGWYRRWGKRLFDVGVVVLALPLWLPLLAAVAGMLRLVQGNPVFYRQIRPGLCGEPFTLVKFRTMREAYDDEGTPLPDVERLTTLGKALRATSLDELPELWNVLRGEMSLVGPRPLLTRYLDNYTPDQARRHDVLPGVTGLAQVSGRQDLKFSSRLALDVWYVDNVSLRLDIRILLRTIGLVLSRRGVHSGQTIDEVDDVGLWGGAPQDVTGEGA
jgi:lipopolysaccharide/colanic/teichoic acid biosynthesis glycosyltransferase